MVGIIGGWMVGSGVSWGLVVFGLFFVDRFDYMCVFKEFIGLVGVKD